MDLPAAGPNRNWDDDRWDGVRRPGIIFWDPVSGFYYRYPFWAFFDRGFAFDRLAYFMALYNPFYADYLRDAHLWRCSGFISGLVSRSARFGPSADAALARYAMGYTVLSPDVVNFALNRAERLSDSIVAQTQALRRLVDDYEAGAISRDIFRDRFKQGIELIRDAAEEVKGDDSLNYIDAAIDMDVEDADKARDIEAFRNLLDDLLQRARQLQAHLGDLQSKEDYQVVSIEEYQKPSAKELAKEVDKIAKALKKSYKRI